ncbi:hypothetical protein C8R44DRAFT_240345 [Mycena epipterygia]|nr:hypothetical protein C8R44DRAFT_240345 [Mycena epipterygia]
MRASSPVRLASHPAQTGSTLPSICAESSQTRAASRAPSTLAQDARESTIGRRNSCPPPTASASASTSASTSSSSVLVRLNRIQQHLHVPHMQLPPCIRDQWCICGSWRSAQLLGHTLPTLAPAGLLACAAATALGTRSRARLVHTPPRAEIQMTLLRTKTFGGRVLAGCSAERAMHATRNCRRHRVPSTPVWDVRRGLPYSNVMVDGGGGRLRCGHGCMRGSPTPSFEFSMAG